MRSYSTLRMTMLAIGALIACTGTVQPVATAVEARRDSLRRDTLRVSVIDQREDSTARDSAQIALVQTLVQAFPSAIVTSVPGSDDTSTPAGSMSLQIFLQRYGTWFSAATWYGQTSLRVRVIDRRGLAAREVIGVIDEKAQRFNMWGNRSAAEALAASFDGAARALTNFVDSVARHQPAGITIVAANPAEYGPYFTVGTGVIAGQAFLTTRGGDVKRAAGRTVTIDPATFNARQWYELSGTALAAFDDIPRDSLFRRAHRETTADADGRFQFTALPAGTYIVRTTVTWEAPDVTAPGALSLQGGVVSEVVRIAPGERRDVILSREGNAFLRVRP